MRSTNPSGSWARRLAALVVTFCAFVPSGSVLAATIYLQIIGNGTTYAPGQAPQWSRTIGQVFVAPEPSGELLNFSFWLASSSDMTFSAYLMEWGDDRPMGPILYKSEPRVSTVVSPECTTTCTADDFNRFDFFPNVAIEPGRRYVAFVSVAEYLPSPFDPTASGRLWSYNGNSTPSTDAYPQGVLGAPPSAVMARIVSTWRLRRSLSRAGIPPRWQLQTRTSTRWTPRRGKHSLRRAGA